MTAWVLCSFKEREARAPRSPRQSVSLCCPAAARGIFWALRLEAWSSGRESGCAACPVGITHGFGEKKVEVVQATVWFLLHRPTSFRLERFDSSS